jgi:hypothetical protein
MAPLPGGDVKLEGGGRGTGWVGVIGGPESSWQPVIARGSSPSNAAPTERFVLFICSFLPMFFYQEYSA